MHIYQIECQVKLRTPADSAAGKLEKTVGECDVEIGLGVEPAAPSGECPIKADEVEQDVALEHACLEVLDEACVQANKPLVPGCTRRCMRAGTNGETHLRATVSI